MRLHVCAWLPPCRQTRLDEEVGVAGAVDEELRGDCAPAVLVLDNGMGDMPASVCPRRHGAGVEEGADAGVFRHKGVEHE